MAYTTIDDPSAYFHTQLYNGNGSTQSITNDANAGDFKPDWLWTKSRNDAFDHIIRDSSRGVSARLLPSFTAAEGGPTGTISFDTNGFTLDSTNTVNKATDNYVAWQWKANGGTTSSNTDGSITSTVQADAGFSIVTYTGNGTGGATIGHGLSSTPAMIIFKDRSEASGWVVYHQALGNTNFVKLNDTNASASDSGNFNNTSPTSSVFTVGTSTNVNKSGNNYIAYCFTEIQGYSKFGRYKGNGHATDGPFVYTGFKPAWLLYRNASRSENWLIEDIKRNPHNRVAGAKLQANVSDAETTETRWGFDFLSNGFKVINTEAQNANNGSGETIIYMAFAEHPFVSSKGVPTTAR